MHRQDNKDEWLEQVLRKGVQRVSAPPELWQRVTLPRMPEPRSSAHRIVWAMAAACVLIVSVFAVAWASHPDRMGHHSGVLVSNRASEIRSWVKARTGVDLPLVTNAQVEMTEAAIENSGLVHVRYRVCGYPAVLTISHHASEMPHHATRDRVVSESTVSWSMNGRAYTLAAQDAAGMRFACLACHTDLTL